MRVAIIGTGDMAHGLAHMFHLNAYDREAYDLVAAEPVPDVRTSDFLVDDVPIIQYREALLVADVVLLCIPSLALKGFVDNNLSTMPEGVIIVDCTNPDRKGQDVAGVLKELGKDNFPRWVKAFNDNGAVTLLQRKSSSKGKPTTRICGPNKQTVQEVARLVEQFGFVPQIVPMERFEGIRTNQQTIGDEWIHAILFMGAMFILIAIYVIFKYKERPNFERWQLCTRAASKMFAWTAIYGFALAQLPGILAKFQRKFTSPTSKLPKVVLWGLGIRKHVGLISLYFVSLHACLVLLIFGQVYFGWLINAYRSHGMRWMGEASMLFGVISFSLYIIMGIASLPSVAQSLTKAQAKCVFCFVAWFALCSGLAHVMILGVESWDTEDKSPYTWAGNMPPITLMASLIPLLVLFLEFVLIITSLTLNLRKKIRRGGSASVRPAAESAMPDLA